MGVTITFLYVKYSIIFILIQNTILLFQEWHLDHDVISPANEYALSWTPSHQNKETFDIYVLQTQAPSIT